MGKTKFFSTIGHAERIRLKSKNTGSCAGNLNGGQLLAEGEQGQPPTSPSTSAAVRAAHLTTASLPASISLAVNWGSVPSPHQLGHVVLSEGR